MKKLFLLVGLLISIISITSFLVLSFAPNTLEAEALLSYINDPKRGLIKESIKDDTKIKLVYRPSDFLIAQELMHSKDKKEKFEKMYTNNLYFILNISKDGQELESYFYNTETDFNKKIGDLSFGMKKYIHLRTDKNNKIDLSDYMYSRMYGMSDGTTFMLIQDKKTISGSEWIDIVIDDFGIGIGEQHFRFYLQDIERTPRLKF